MNSNMDSSFRWNDEQHGAPKEPLRLSACQQATRNALIGVTSDLVKRVWQHRNGEGEGFTRRHRIHDLVWYEPHETMETAIARETTLKAWKRIWKIALVESTNPQWRDLFADIIA